MADVLDINLEWMIALAKDGDGEQLARHIRDNGTLASPLREFLAGIVDGSIKLKRRRKQTWTEQTRRKSGSMKERNAAFLIDRVLDQEGRQRDREQRITRDVCKRLGTTPEAVALYRKHRTR